MDMDLNVLSLRELKDMQSRINKAISSYEDRKKKEALSELEDKARSLGYSLAELLGDSDAKAVRKRGPSVAKYANPLNSDETWSGRGRKPAWFIAAVENGQKPEDMIL